MGSNATPATSDDLRLRDVELDDLPIFFEHQRDPDASRMTGFPPRDWDRFSAHWTTMLADPSIITQTILVSGQVVGHVVSFEHEGRREVGSWLGQQFRGQGVAVRALATFLDQVQVRPLYAYVAAHNHAARRAAEKCGFKLCAEDRLPAAADQAIEELLLKLD